MFHFSTDASSEFLLETNISCNNEMDPTPVSLPIGDLRMPSSWTVRVHGPDPDDEPYMLQKSGQQVFL